MPKIHARLLTAAAAMLTLTIAAAAQQYPSKPIRLIIPFPPGGANDVIGRVIATALGERMGRQVVVDNRGGANGLVGTELTANAPADGYTLLFISQSFAVNPWMYKLPYDPIKSFTPVAILASSPIVLVVNPGLPVNSVGDLITLAKKQPGQLQYASAGIGSANHLGGALFSLSAKVDMLHVPFKGAGPAMIDVVAGHTKVMFAALLPAAPHIRSGRLRALGVGSSKRSSIFPETPSIAEAGVPGYESGNWFGIIAPAGTPAPIVERLHREISAALDTSAVQKQFASDGADIIRMTPAGFGDYIGSELKLWQRVVKEAGIKAE